MKRLLSILVVSFVLVAGFNGIVFAGIDTVQTFPTIIGEKRDGTK